MCLIYKCVFYYISLKKIKVLVMIKFFVVMVVFFENVVMDERK